MNPLLQNPPDPNAHPGDAQPPIAPPNDDSIFRIVWWRDNGRCVPASFHVLATVIAQDADVAQIAADTQFPDVKGQTVCIPQALVETLINEANEAAKELAEQQKFEQQALEEAGKAEQAKRDAIIESQKQEAAQAQFQKNQAGLHAARQRMGLK